MFTPLQNDGDNLHRLNELPCLIKRASHSESFSLKPEIGLLILLGGGNWGGTFKTYLRNVDKSNSVDPEAFRSLLCIRHRLCCIKFLPK